MILVLAGGSEAKKFTGMLDRNEISYLCVFSNFAAAGSYGDGSAIVGRFQKESMLSLLKREEIKGVADLCEAPDARQSQAAMAACEDLGIPYVKYLHMPVSLDALFGARMNGSYDKIAENINTRIGNVLLYAGPETVRALVKRVKDPARLYTPILRGIRFDVDLAMEFDLPLRNVVELEGVDGVEAVKTAIGKTEAKLLICDGTVSIPDKLEGAKQLGVDGIVTHKMGIEFSKTVWNIAELMNMVRNWK